VDDQIRDVKAHRSTAPELGVDHVAGLDERPIVGAGLLSCGIRPEVAREELRDGGERLERRIVFNQLVIIPHERNR
jgi:hypothetical protein